MFALTLVVSAAAVAQAAGTSDSNRPDGFNGQVQLSRYTTSEAKPDGRLSQPMGVVALVHFPRATVTTVGDAMRHLLVRTGYALADEAALEPVAKALLSLPLPESHRVLGPYRVDDMVQVLLGDRWVMQLDHLQRQLRFATASEAQPVGNPMGQGSPPASLTAKADATAGDKP